jgi:hypothetical protein
LTGIGALDRVVLIPRRCDRRRAIGDHDIVSGQRPPSALLLHPNIEKKRRVAVRRLAFAGNRGKEPVNRQFGIASRRGGQVFQIGKKLVPRISSAGLVGIAELQRQAAATDSSANCARVRTICAVTRLAANSARARRRTARRLANSLAQRISLTPPIGVSRRPMSPHTAQWHFPALPLKPRRVVATPSRRPDDAMQPDQPQWWQ